MSHSLRPCHRQRDNISVPDSDVPRVHYRGVNYTGGSLNPARSFGPAVIAGFDKHHWIYWLGPILGSLLATGLYRLLKVLEYETVNPGQDSAGDAAAESYRCAISKPSLPRGDSAHSDEKRKFPSISEVTTIGVDGTTVSYARGPNMEAAHA